MASYVAKVARQCEEATETKELDLTDCDLTSVPHAVYHILRETTVQSATFSNNKLKSVPGRLCSAFGGVSHLNFSGNRITTLPMEFAELQELLTLDLSKNKLSNIPDGIVVLQKLESLCLDDNEITSVDWQDLRARIPTLKQVSISNNPLSVDSRLQASTIPSLTIVLEKGG
ncbi:leucine-rich repeat-containing protein 20-like [Sycon ciliatum]|uniref:leucine-rich repeat-containing protein 20-like n=1 Tax=Sycon ciliatum TaxID=27933 RepID=UPI0020A9EA9D|eukprot:scpid84758/ scgid12771/ Leucine-rich repeat-containing protein 20